MRKVFLSDLKGNEILGKTLFDEAGRIILKDGVTLTDRLIQKLEELGFTSVYITDQYSSGIESEDIISDELRQETKSSIKEMATNFYKKGQASFDGVIKSANAIIDEITDNKDVMVNISEIRSKDESLFSHSVNVCSLATITALRLGYNMLRVKEISTGAVLHDVGKISLLKSNNLQINQIDQLPEDILKTHPRVGYDTLNTDYAFNPVTKIIPLMHHERMDGSGYPLKLKGAEVHEAARLVAICDTFENMVAGNSEYGNMPVYQVVEYLQASTHLFDPEILKVFIQNLALYPNGTVVDLSSGYKGIVVSQNKAMPSRPVVRIIKDNQNNDVGTPYEVDLVKELTLFVTGTVTL